MRGLKSAALVSLAIAALACHRDNSDLKVETVEGSKPAFATTVVMANKATTGQLVQGFHVLEGNSWRWTAGHFSATLGVPPIARREGANLVVHFSLPEVVMSRVHATKLSATVNGVPIDPEEYTKSGEYTYSKQVPASALTRDVAGVNFSLSQYLPSGTLEGRELGIVVSSIGLETK